MEGGFSPSDLRGAYDIPESGGSEQIVAIVDAYKDPNAESDLNVYRHEYGLPECTASNKCFKQVNQEGTEGSYPENEPHWSVETSIDVDMVSAVCPDCKILLVEATNEKNNAEGVPNLYIAENEAASLEEATTHRKATEISDSWGRRSSRPRPHTTNTSNTPMSRSRRPGGTTATGSTIRPPHRR